MNMKKPKKYTHYEEQLALSDRTIKSIRAELKNKHSARSLTNLRYRLRKQKQFDDLVAKVNRLGKKKK